MNVLPPHTVTQRRAALLLAAFVWALLAGAFLHPLGEAAHVCSEQAGHVDADPGHVHDAGGCALCHLTRELGQTRPADLRPASLGLSPRAEATRRPAAAAPRAPARLAFFSRGPPARG